MAFQWQGAGAGIVVRLLPSIDAMNAVTVSTVSIYIKKANHK